MTDTTLSAPAIFAIALAFALTGLVAYELVVTHPNAEQLVRWAQAPIDAALGL